MGTSEMRNVGTEANPVSWLHERAVALICDELRRGDYIQSGSRVSHPVSLRLPNGELTSNLNEGVNEVVIPGEWDQVGGIVPDLILYNDKREPVRIIEVIVTSHPTPEKQRKLDQLAKRGVDVVLVKVTKSADLFDLVAANKPDFKWFIQTGSAEFGSYTSDPNRAVTQLMNALQRCDPKVRRTFVEFCREMGSLESLYPVRPDNPLKGKLRN